MRKPFFDTERLASFASRPIIALFVVVLLLAALPAAAWLDLASISERTLRTQANAFDRVMTSIRNFYSSNIVNRVLSSKGEVHVVSQVCPNDNWTPEIQAGTLQLVSFTYTLTFAGFTDPYITITAP